MQRNRRGGSRPSLAGRDIVYCADNQAFFAESPALSPAIAFLAAK
jgi:hypothetical protein